MLDLGTGTQPTPARRRQDAIHPDRGPSVLLIEVRPQRLELVSVTHGLTGDPGTLVPRRDDAAQP